MILPASYAPFPPRTLPAGGFPREKWESVDPDVLTTIGEEITSLSARLSAETHQLLSLIAEFDRLEGWKPAGFASCVDWLAYNTRLDKMTAREKVRVARALARLPETSAAMARGELSFSQARAITRVADPECEEELLDHANALSAAALEKLVRSWKQLDRADKAADEAAVEEKRHAARCLSIFPDEDGSYLIRGRLDPEVGTLLMRAIEAAGDSLYQGSVPETKPEQRRADALGFLAERAMAAGFGGAGQGEREEVGSEGRVDDRGETIDADGGRAERYLVVLHMNEGNGPTLEDGTRVSAETSMRVACDASVVRASAGDSPTMTARTRTVPPRMRRALQIRDRGCRFPGCGSRFTDAHHVRHWADGGHTQLDNLVLLCRTHHRLLHEGGFRLEADPLRPGHPRFFDPRGFRIPETPPPMRIGNRCIGGKSARWEEDVPLAFYLRALASAG